MKKLLVCLLAMVLLFSASALADARLDKVVDLEKDVTLCRYSNNYIARTDEGYRLFDKDGNLLSGVYKSMSAVENGEYLKVQNVSNKENINCLGLLDAMGREIFQMHYGAIATYYGDGWVFAHVLSPAPGDVGEYSDGQGNKYIISRTDVAYKGKFLGSLSREDFQGSYNIYTRGPNIFVKCTSQKGYWLDSSFNRRDVTSESYLYTNEYTSSYKSSVIHNPTQQEAFTASCTLTPEQVEQHIWYDSSKKQLLDLQGNVLADKIHYDSVSYRHNYMEVDAESYTYSGVITFDGKEVIPPKYEDIAYYTTGFFGSGYNAVIDDKGNLYYYDEAGNITASAEYGLSSSDYKGFSNNAPMVYVKNMGKYMIITATHGTLSETYDDVITCSEYQKVMAVCKDDLWGVIDMAGNVVVPFELTSSPSISRDGTTVYGRTKDRVYRLYCLSYTDGQAAANAQTGAQEETAAPAADGSWICECGTVNTGKFCGFCGGKKPEATPTPTPAPTPAPAADGSWTCECGTVNTGKFCGECGSKKPEATPAPAADDGSWTCECGTVNTGKFCGECGSKKPEQAPQCSGCGYIPQGEAPKFCPECGTKF